MLLQVFQIEGETLFIFLISWSVKNDCFLKKSSKVRRKADLFWKFARRMNPNDTFSWTRRQDSSKSRLFRENRIFFKTGQQWYILLSLFCEPACRINPNHNFFKLNDYWSNQITHNEFLVKKIDVIDEIRKHLNMNYKNVGNREISFVHNLTTNFTCLSNRVAHPFGHNLKANPRIYQIVWHIHLVTTWRQIKYLCIPNLKANPHVYQIVWHIQLFTI